MGGIKEKVLAARRAGVQEVILSQENKMDVDEDLQPEQLGDLKVHFVETVEQVLDIALMPSEDTPAKKTANGPVNTTAPEAAQESSEAPASQHAS